MDLQVDHCHPSSTSTLVDCYCRPHWCCKPQLWPPKFIGILQNRHALSILKSLWQGTSLTSKLAHKTHIVSLVSPMARVKQWSILMVSQLHMGIFFLLLSMRINLLDGNHYSTCMMTCMIWSQQRVWQVVEERILI